jgi:hypothetical protein
MAGIAAGLIALVGPAHAVAQQVCRPTLAVTGARFSEVQPPALSRLWVAFVAVDASACRAHSSGHFEIVLSRLKENGPELEFGERFVWLPPSVTIGIDFWADEAVERYAITAVTPCPCPE